MGEESGIPFGNYTLLRRVARGGMAEVFVARQKGIDGFDRVVAIKRILPHLLDDKSFVGMFQDEARLAARLSHPNIVHIYDYGRVEEHFFIAMEFMHGVHSGDLIRLAAEQPMPIALAARIGADACAGLYYAHNRLDDEGNPMQLVHRDISPPNLLVSYDGVIKIVDFGIAKAVSSIEQTRPGVVKGKYAYMSPEQTMGQALNGRSDVFSLGIVLWELLSGQPAVTRLDQVTAMKAIRDGKVPPIDSVREDVPQALSDALSGALQKDPSKRLDARAFGNALESFIKSSSEIATSMEVGAWLHDRVPPASVLGPYSERLRVSSQCMDTAADLSPRQNPDDNGDLALLDMPKNHDESRGSVVCALPKAHFADAHNTQVLAASGDMLVAPNEPVHLKSANADSVLISSRLVDAGNGQFPGDVLRTAELEKLSELGELDYDDEDEPTAMVRAPAKVALSTIAGSARSESAKLQGVARTAAEQHEYRNNTQTVEDAPPVRNHPEAKPPVPGANHSSPTPPPQASTWPRQQTSQVSPSQRGRWLIGLALLAAIALVSAALLKDESQADLATDLGDTGTMPASRPSASGAITATAKEQRTNTAIVVTPLLDAGVLSPDAPGAKLDTALIAPAGARSTTKKNSQTKRRHKRKARKRIAPKRTGLLEVTASPKADVYLRQRRLGSTPLTNQPLPPGRYSLVFKARGRKSVTKTAIIRSGRITKLSVRLEP